MSRSGAKNWHQEAMYLRKGGGWFLVFVGLYFLLAMLSYQVDDPSWANNIPLDQARNLGGVIGAWVAYSAYFLFGAPAMVLLPLAIFMSAARLFKPAYEQSSIWNRHLIIWLAATLAIAACCGLATIHFVAPELPASSGGRLGVLVMNSFYPLFNMVGSTILLLGLIVASFTIMTGIAWLKVVDRVGLCLFVAAQSVVNAKKWLQSRLLVHERSVERSQIVSKRKQKLRQRTPPKIGSAISSLSRGEKANQKHQITLPIDGREELPPMSLLDQEAAAVSHYSKDEVEQLARQLEIKLEDFGITAQVTEAQPGPVVTRFEVVPAPGTKSSSISGIQKDIARSLSLPSIRVVEVIPGKSSIGIEIPNRKRAVVKFGELLRSDEYEKQHSPLTLALGKDVAGQAVFIDLEKLPHLLVAGTTGSGKSVAVHSMLASLLFRNRPSQVRLILVDPKMLELKSYEHIHHLLLPVITDMQEAAGALYWAVTEMERRYRLMAALNVRSIGSYNNKILKAQKKKQPIADPLFDADKHEDGATAPLLETMPYIVIFIDEFADMIMMVGKKVEEMIIRLAQKARAAGLHLVLATQRPSVNIITGLVKANVPARIACQVSSKVDSRTILDQNGAEQLLGQGDMLCLMPSYSTPLRVHGAFISDNEVQAVTDFIRQQGPPAYIENIEASDTATVGLDISDAKDPLYNQAVEIVIESRKASISYLQRRLKVGYNRAARMIEDMEAAKIVSRIHSNGSREVLVAAPGKD
ncbi:MAG: DNA translocase FtsK 4TM domain-containing protein [Chromatiales bacterium]|nr:DNA translocase FtsK 4TM domain-containing protein [Chromatiales bacterium]